MRPVIALATLGFFAATPALAAPVAIPIRQTVLANGLSRYSVAVGIGNASVEAMLDTGSLGLRLLPGAVPADSYRLTDAETETGYKSGLSLKGKIATAAVRIGAAAQGATLPLQMVETLGCLKEIPHCPAQTLKPGAFGFGGGGVAGQGFKAILGIALPLPGQESGTVNPLIAFAQSWIVILPLPGQIAPGTLILDPGPGDLAGFTRFAEFTALPFLKIGGIPGCLENCATSANYCGPIMLDTGSDGMQVWNGGALDAQTPWPQDAPVTLVFGDSHSKIRLDFRSNGREPASRVQWAAKLAGRQPTVINAGLLPFFQYAILYDAGKNGIGFGARP